MAYPDSKKAWHQIVQTLSTEAGQKVTPLCRLFGNSTQAYYQHQVHDPSVGIRTQLYVQYARHIRHQAPRIGGVKLYHLCQKSFGDLHLGRDAFIELLREEGLMLRIRKRRARTTDSTHSYRLYPNLIRGVLPIRANEVWVSDITYIPTQQGFCYLSLITDLYSHRIMGYKLAPTLQYIHTEQALQEAIEQVLQEGGSLQGLIHHSDRGGQYAYPSYIQLLLQHHIQISMTQQGDPLENAVAERVNGILKQEWLNRYDFLNKEQVEPFVRQAIHFYNYQRPHASVNMLTPMEAYHRNGVLKRCWKNYYPCANGSAAE